MRAISLLLICIALLSCQKNYTCVCISSISQQDTIVDGVKTTKLGSKGYSRTCSDYEAKKSTLKNCHLQ